MNWRLVLILLKLIDRFGFPYFLVLVSFWFAKAIEQELQKRVTSPSLSSRWSALSAKQRHKNNQRPSAMKKIMKFSPGKMLSTGFVILAALAVATPQAQGSSCTPPPAGLVSWWAGESNALDSAGANNGIAQNITYTNGEAGLAFYLNNSNAYVEVPTSSSLNVGTGNGFTFETWIYPANLNPQPIAEWNNNAGDPGTGAHLWLSVSKFVPGPTGCLYANLIDAC